MTPRDSDALIRQCTRNHSPEVCRRCISTSVWRSTGSTARSFSDPNSSLSVLHGAPIHTQDVDIVHRRDPDNIARLLRLLQPADENKRDLVILQRAQEAEQPTFHARAPGCAGGCAPGRPDDPQSPAGVQPASARETLE
ncbi:MAG: hypothetical protein ACRD0Y_11780 [Terriglobales bacterium]